MEAKLHVYRFLVRSSEPGAHPPYMCICPFDEVARTDQLFIGVFAPPSSKYLRLGTILSIGSFSLRLEGMLGGRYRDSEYQR